MLTATLSLVALTGCPPAVVAPPPAPLQRAIDAGDALAIADALEDLIDEGKDTNDDRQLAYDHVKRHEQLDKPTAAYAYARAMATGRLVQTRGLTAAFLIREMEDWAKKSVSLDPTFRDGAATRMLGLLYVLVPASLLSSGDSEKGLEMLEGLVRAHPESPENHLRFAEAVIALGDAGQATLPLCRALHEKASLRKADQRHLDKLFQDAGSPPCP